MPERYSTATIAAMQEEIQPKSNWLVSTFFGTQTFFDTHTIEFDVIRKGQRMAPFVAPTVAGKPMRRSDRWLTKQMKAAYIKPKTFIDPTRPLSRLPGEPWGGNLSPMERWNRLMAEDIALHGDMLDNRLEWMASSILQSGTLVVSGDDYPTQTVDFALSSNLQVALAGTATWDQATSRPLADIEKMSLLVREESYGAVCSDVIMDAKAWALFKDHKDVKDLGNLLVGRDPGLNQTSIDRGPRNNIFANGAGGELVATIYGRYRIWVYEAYYEDDDGVTHKLIDDNTVIVISQAGFAGKQLYGAILDSDARFQAVRQFIKSRSQWDPAGEEVLSQSGAMLSPGRVNTWGVLKVA